MKYYFGNPIVSIGSFFKLDTIEMVVFGNLIVSIGSFLKLNSTLYIRKNYMLIFKALVIVIHFCYFLVLPDFLGGGLLFLVDLGMVGVVTSWCSSYSRSPPGRF